MAENPFFLFLKKNLKTQKNQRAEKARNICYSNTIKIYALRIMYKSKKKKPKRTSTLDK